MFNFILRKNKNFTWIFIFNIISNFTRIFFKKKKSIRMKLNLYWFAKSIRTKFYRYKFYFEKSFNWVDINIQFLQNQFEWNFIDTNFISKNHLTQIYWVDININLFNLFQKIKFLLHPIKFFDFHQFNFLQNQFEWKII